jgi:predicted NBD/HSP70 family sugar kinase
MTGKIRGGNQGGLKEFNERLILHVIRRAGSIPSAEIARKTGLSVQSVSRIVNRLLHDQLIVKQNRRRVKGKVGQPSVPISLNPAGAYSVGVKIGRRSLDVLIVNFVGEILRQITERYAYPDPDVVLPQVNANVAAALKFLDANQRERVVGIGVAAPYGLGDWPQELSGPPEILAKWSEIDLRQKIADHQELPVWLEHDAKSACMADLLLQRDGSRFENYLYIFIGTIIGGATVLDGLVYRGPAGFAGAIGPMPIPSAFDPNKKKSKHLTVPLLRCASRYLLDERLHELGFDSQLEVPLAGRPKSFKPPRKVAKAIDDWITTTAAAIAVAIHCTISTFDFQGIVVDGALPEALVEELTNRVDAHLNEFSFTGLVRPRLVAGSLGNDARALGGAILPLYWSFAPDKEVVLNLDGATVRSLSA